MLLPNTRKRRVLFFIKDEAPTAEESAAAKLLGTSMFRNASQVQPDEKPEDCHAVAGAIPPAYAKLPVAEPPAPVVPAPEPAVVQEPEPVQPPEPEPEPVVELAPIVAKRGKGKAKK